MISSAADVSTSAEASDCRPSSGLSINQPATVEAQFFLVVMTSLRFFQQTHNSPSLKEQTLQTSAKTQTFSILQNSGALLHLTVPLGRGKRNKSVEPNIIARR